MRERDNSIDVMRGLAMILVVLGHSIEIFFNTAIRPDLEFQEDAFELWRVIYSFHVPAFFYISGVAGLRMSKKEFREILISAATLGLIAAFTQLLAGPLLELVDHGFDAKRMVIRSLWPLAHGGDWLTLVVTWFLVSLAFVYVLAWLFLNSKIKGQILVIFIALAAYVAARYFSIQYFQMQTWAIGLGWFLLGYWTAPTAMNLRASSAKLWLGSATCAALLLGTYSLNDGCMGGLCDRNGYSSFAVLIARGYVGFVPLFILTALAGISMLFALSKLISATAFGRLLIYIGRRTLPLLVLRVGPETYSI